MGGIPRVSEDLYMVYLLLCAAVQVAAFIVSGRSLGAFSACILLLGVLSEELFFRGALLGFLKKASPAKKILISSAAFALMHLFCAPSAGIQAALARAGIAFAAGLVFAGLTLRSGSVMPAFAAHLAADLAFLRIGAPALLYIDPGTGSMLFTVLLGIIGAAAYSIRVFAMKMRVRIGGRGKTDARRVPLAIFSDNKRYWNVFEPVVRELQKRGLDILYLTASQDDPAFAYASGCEKASGTGSFTAEFAGEGNKMFGRLNNLNACIVLSTTPGLEVYQWKRSAQVRYYVHIPHAASEIILYRMFGTDYYDAVLLSGQYQADDIRALEELRKLPPKDLRMIGIPYMDEMAKRLEKEGPAADHPRTVLLAPSWGKSAIFSVYGGRIIDVLLKTGYHIIVRPHPQSFTAEKDVLEPIMAEYPPSEQLEWNRDVDNFDVLRRSDILVSDFSGVIFDFTLIYDKPVIYTDPEIDYAPYDAWWLNRPLWTHSALPRLGKQLTGENMQDLKSLIDECLTDPAYAKGRREVKAETWAFEGQGAVRAADYIMQKYEELAGKEVQ